MDNPRTPFTIAAAIGMVAGFYFGGNSLTARMMTGEHAAILACAGFLFSIALGIWLDIEIRSKQNPHQKTERLLMELLRRMPKPEDKPSEREI